MLCTRVNLIEKALQIDLNIENVNDTGNGTRPWRGTFDVLLQTCFPLLCTQEADPHGLHPQAPSPATFQLYSEAGFYQREIKG